MDKKQNKVEKLVNDMELEQVSGGYVGYDWNKKYASIYEVLGIEHNRNTSKKDTYYIGDTEIPKKFAYALARYCKGNENEAKNIALSIKKHESDCSVDELCDYLNEKLS